MGAVLAMAMTVRAQTAATLTDLGGTAPTPGTYDISQLSTQGQTNKPDGLNYYTDNQSGHGTGEPGQTFTTGGGAAGFTLTSLAIKTGGGTSSGVGTSQSYLLHIYSVSGGTATVIATYTADNFSFADGDWLQWTNLNLPLTTNAAYGYSFGKASNTTGGWEAMGNSSTNLYPGGELALMPVAGGAITFSSTHYYDAVFDVGLIPSVPNPAVVTNSPATGIQGTVATLNGTVISTGSSIPSVTIYYGSSDGGTNAGTWAGSVALGPQTGNFSTTISGLQTNTTYYFTAQASNNAGITWAMPSKSFITPALLNATNPATLTDLGANDPAPGLSDIFQLSTSGQVGGPDGLNYYTDNQSNHGAGEPGQTFTTGTTSTGYLFNSLAIRTGGGTSSGVATPQSYLLHIYSVSGGTATVIATYTADNFSFTDGDWLQWSGFNLLLATNAVYAFSFGKADAAVGGWEAMGNASANPYAGGELALLPVAGGAITFSSSHNYDAVFDVGLIGFGAGPAGITNHPATGILTTAATLNGGIVSVGASVPQVKFFYGETDGGQNASAWSNAVALGSQIGNFAATVSGLKASTTYYFTAQASNTAGLSWAVPSRSFTTPIPAPPAVTNRPATGVSAAFATLNGQVLDAGNEPPTTTIYYGTTDGGNNPAAWSGQISVGAQAGTFSAQVAGLTPDTTYYFTTFATNSAGAAWGGPSQSFTTLTLKRVSVLTYHYDNTRQGQNTNETLLTPANVNAASFGKLFTYPVDGYVYAQPLIMTNLNMPGKGVRNVLFVATMHDSVYAFDADSNGDANGGLLWQTNVGVSSPSPITEFGRRYHSVGNLDVVPEEGMTGTPVIDPATGTLYVDAFTREVVPGVSTNYFHRIHALNVTNGTERPYSPVVVAGSVPGKGVSGDNYTETQNGSTVTFSAVQHCQRPALTLAGGNLYVAYGSHDDTDPYHGWVFGYNATNLALVSIYCTTPNATTGAFGGNAGEGALWMGGNGLCVDAQTNLYFETGNGSFSANTNGGDYADSFVKLSTVSNKLAVADYFTPYNQLSLQNADSDLGSGGPLLLPDSVGSAAHPHLIVGAGKEGKIFLLDRDNMGRYDGTDGKNGSDTNNVQELPGAIGGVWDSPAYWNNYIFYHGNGDVLKAFYITNGLFAATPTSRSATSFGFPGATPTVSANGTNNGIVWDVDPTPYLSSGPAVLHAYNATNVAIELYNSSQNLARDNPGGAVKMVPPVIAGGKVYVGAEYAVSVFGNALFIATPTIAPNGGSFQNSVVVTLADATAGASIYYTLDGTPPSTSSTLYTGPLTLTNSALLQAVAAASGAVNSGVASASFVNMAAAGSGTGLTGAYYTNHTSVSPFTGSPVLVQTNATINFNWGANGPDPSVGKTNFTVRWTGCVQPQFNETYQFITTADDGVRLYLNGQLLIDDWVNKTSATSRTNSIALVAQQLYNLELDYYQKTNNASGALSWSSPSTLAAIVPQTQLYPFTNPPPAVVLTAPAGGASYTASASVTISAEADATYNPVSFVSFYAGGTYLGSVSNAPYTLTATGLSAGNYALTAVAVDGSGLSSTSAPVNITVTAGSGQPYGLTARNPAPAYFNMPATFEGALPPLLSETGIFSNTPSMTPVNSLIAYAPNTVLWSDGAVKTRYFAVPGNGITATPDQQIGFAPTGSWTFPAGTVFVKTFQLNTDTTNPNVRHRLETRLLVRNANGAVYGVTYKWRADNSDADLLTGSLSEDITITNATGTTTQTWYYPSPADCLTCHTPAANYVLGVNSRQLNGDLTYPATGVTDNQLRTLNRLGLFNPAFDEADITNFEKLSAITNLNASLEERARSYLDVNCAVCHRPGGAGITFDARYDTPLASQNLTNYPAAVSLGYDHAQIVAPRDVWRSMIWQRMNTTNNAYKMPNLARNLIDTNAVQVIGDWINSLPGTPALPPPGLLPEGGSFVASVNVAVQPPTNNVLIYYTLDGSLPTTNSLLYTGPFNLLNNATVSASTFATGYMNSVATSAQFLVEPLHFTSEGFTNNVFQLSFAGTAGSNYVLQASTNLSNWTPVSTNQAVTNLFNLFDVKATNYPYRFYRVLRQ